MDNRERAPREPRASGQSHDRAPIVTIQPRQTPNNCDRVTRVMTDSRQSPNRCDSNDRALTEPSESCESHNRARTVTIIAVIMIVPQESLDRALKVIIEL